MDIGEPANQKETKFVETYLKAAENVEMTDQDVEIAENHGTEFKHESLMEYSNIQLDFIKVFDERVFVMVIGKFILKYYNSPIQYRTYVTWAYKLISLHIEDSSQNILKHINPIIEFKLCLYTMFRFGIFSNLLLHRQSNKIKNFSRCQKELK